MTPASIRNCNPGACFPGPSSKRYGSTTYQPLMGGKYKIATFASHEAGAAAMFDLLARQYSNRTLADAIRKWAGGLYVAEYLKGIRDRGGFSYDVFLDDDFFRDADKAISLAKAMARHEAGRDYPMSETEWRRAHAWAISNLPPPKPAKAPPAAPVAPTWEPDNPLPSPRPEARVAEVKASRKWRISEWWSRLTASVGLGIIGTKSADEAGVLPGALELVKKFASDNAAFLIVGGVVAGLVVSEMVKSMTKEDITEGRYRPSGGE